jgi:hypothetical protein
MLLARMFFLRKARDHVHDAEPDFLDSLISNSAFSIRLEYALAVNRRKILIMTLSTQLGLHHT